MATCQVLPVKTHREHLRQSRSQRNAGRLSAVILQHAEYGHIRFSWIRLGILREMSLLSPLGALPKYSLASGTLVSTKPGGLVFEKEREAVDGYNIFLRPLSAY